VYRPNVSIVGKSIHGFKFVCTHSVGARTVFVIVNKDNRLPCMSSRLLASSLSLHFCHLGPYGRRLQIDARADELIGLDKRFLGDGVLVTVVVDEPIATFAYLLWKTAKRRLFLPRPLIRRSLAW
jgi:hypothetical protein